MRFPHRQETDARSAHLAVPFVRWPFWIQMLEIANFMKIVTFARFLLCFCGFGCCDRSGRRAAHRSQNLVHFDVDQLDCQSWMQAIMQKRFWMPSRDRWPGLVTSNFVKTLFCVKQGSLPEIGHKQFCENAFPRIAARDWPRAIL